MCLDNFKWTKILRECLDGENIRWHERDMLNNVGIETWWAEDGTFWRFTEYEDNHTMLDMMSQQVDVTPAVVLALRQKFSSLKS